MIGIKEEELKVIHQHSYDAEPGIRLYFSALEAFVNAQAALSYEQQRYIQKFLEGIDAPFFKEMFEAAIGASSKDIVFLPIRVEGETLTVREIAELCRVSVQMIRRACEEGKIEAYKGKKRSWIIPKQSFLESDIYAKWMSDKVQTWSVLEGAAGAFTENKEFISGLEREELHRKSEE